jgi:hypothetical protein
MDAKKTDAIRHNDLRAQLQLQDVPAATRRDPLPLWLAPRHRSIIIQQQQQDPPKPKNVEAAIADDLWAY